MSRDLGTHYARKTIKYSGRKVKGNRFERGEPNFRYASTKIESVTIDLQKQRPTKMGGRIT
jgi:hypothetical protein